MLRCLLGLLFLPCLPLAARAAAPARVLIPPLKTSIYVGSVTLTTSEFVREGDSFTANYEAKVWPWLFWSESGSIRIRVPAEDFEKLARGERIEFAGDALNQKRKARTVTGRADQGTGATGKIKVRIGVDGTELIFNGTYRLEN